MFSASQAAGASERTYSKHELNSQVGEILEINVTEHESWL